MNNYKKLFSTFLNNSKFIITTHVNPDADAIGSEMAIVGILEQLGKEYQVINTSRTPYTLEFLDYNSCVEYYDCERHDKLIQEADVAIFLDLNSLKRTVRIAEQFREFDGIKICIDHHTNPEDFADLMFIDENKSSTGEIIFDFIDSTKELKFDKRIALSIYAAIMTDTGSFRYSKTNSDLHIKIAKLLEYGLEPEKIYDAIYAQYEFSRVKLLGEALHSISITDSKKVSYMVVTQESLKISGGIESDVDGFVNFALTSSGVEIGILFFELKDGIKISFRSKGEIPVNELAEEFGGGGHRNASGTRLHDVTLEEMIPKVLSSAEKLLQN